MLNFFSANVVSAKVVAVTTRFTRCESSWRRQGSSSTSLHVLHKAYNSVDRNALWTVLQRCYHLPEKLLFIIRAMYDESTPAVRAYGKTSDEFAVMSGIRQGVCWHQLSSTCSLMLSFAWPLMITLRKAEGCELYSTLMPSW